MTVQSAAGVMEISVTTDAQGDPWIKVHGEDGCFTNRAIEALIHELAAAINKSATLDEPEPLESVSTLLVGTVIEWTRSFGDITATEHVSKVGTNRWLICGAVATCGDSYIDENYPGSTYRVIVEGTK